MDEQDFERYKRLRAIKRQSLLEAWERHVQFLFEASPDEWMVYQFGGTVEEWRAYREQRTADARPPSPPPLG